MLSAGIPIHRGLELLANRWGEPMLERVSMYLARGVLRGQSLSEAMLEQADQFSRFQINLVRVGERSGSLHRVLGHLADYEEWRYQQTLRLRSLLTYPAVLLVACTIMLTLAPPLLLEGQTRLLASSGVELPPLSRAVMWLSDLVRNPSLWLTLAVILLVVARVARRPARGFLRSAVERIGIVRTLLRKAAAARFCHALAVQVEAGLPLADSLVLAAQSSADAMLEQRIGIVLRALKAGRTLTEGLREADYFPPTLLAAAQAGELAGKVGRSLLWVTRLLDSELESALESFIATLEPLLLLWIGGVVALLLAATLLPVVKVLEAL
ncbi:MAG: type II secretion system F family protein [Armatimonadetes bacterium]|nr:type II secretion system F family protein [Armatimonadota bacterium]